MKKFITMLLFLVSTLAYADDSQNCCNEGGIVYGDKWAFLVSAPNGWLMTTKSNLEVNVAFFQNKKRDDLQTTPTFMYITAFKKPDSTSSLDNFIANDESNFKAESTTLIVTKDIQLSVKNKNIIVRKFDHTRNQRSELIAYLEYDDMIYTLVITAPSESELSALRNAFVEMIDSFQPMNKSD